MNMLKFQGNIYLMCVLGSSFLYHLEKLLWTGYHFVESASANEFSLKEKEQILENWTDDTLKTKFQVEDITKLWIKISTSIYTMK